MYLAKYQHLPDLAAFPINVKFLLYFLCRKKHVGKNEPWTKFRINLIALHFSPEGRKLSWQGCSVHAMGAGNPSVSQARERMEQHQTLLCSDHSPGAAPALLALCHCSHSPPQVQ